MGYITYMYVWILFLLKYIYNVHVYSGVLHDVDILMLSIS